MKTKILMSNGDIMKLKNQGEIQNDLVRHEALLQTYSDKIDRLEKEMKEIKKKLPIHQNLWDS